MPQLMPLNWIFSSLMVFIVLVSASVIYSEKINKDYMNNVESGVNKLSGLWCW